MTTSTPRTLPSKIVRFDIRSIPKKPPAPSVRIKDQARRNAACPDRPPVDDTVEHVGNSARSLSVNC
jgi:hypothetical protein